MAKSGGQRTNSKEGKMKWKDMREIFATFYMFALFAIFTVPQSWCVPYAACMIVFLFVFLSIESSYLEEK